MSARTDFLRREEENIEKTLVLLEDLLGRNALSAHETAALGTYLQNVYSGVERVIRSLLDTRGIRVAASPTWHKELLQRANREGLMSSDQFDGFLELLGFRHLHVHGYSHTLNEDRLREIAVPTPALVRAFLHGVAGKE